MSNEVRLNELIVGQEYWLDDCKDESGIFKKRQGNTFYFEPVEIKVYSVIEEGQGDDENIGLVAFSYWPEDEVDPEDVFYLKE